jgi:hypothetical protein
MAERVRIIDKKVEEVTSSGSRLPTSLRLHLKKKFRLAASPSPNRPQPGSASQLKSASSCRGAACSPQWWPISIQISNWILSPCLQCPTPPTPSFFSNFVSSAVAVHLRRRIRSQPPESYGGCLNVEGMPPAGDLLTGTAEAVLARCQRDSVHA